MPVIVPKILLWLFVLNLGISLGAGLYESRIEVPRWLVATAPGEYRWDRAAAVAADAGLRFWAFVTTMPLTLLTLASLVAAWWLPAPVRAWWLAAGAIVLCERLSTFGYFIPTMIRLMTDGAFTEPEAAAKALAWAKLGWVRHAANLAGLLAAMKAFALFYAGPGRG
jgi:hypothetical protein